MPAMLDKISTLWPEIIMFVGAVVCLFTGLSSKRDVRRATVAVVAITLVLAAILAAAIGVKDATGLGLGSLTLYVKLAVAGVGLILLMVAGGVPHGLRQDRAAEAAPVFDPTLARSGEFFAFFLLSLTGVMLTAGAGDLPWLFLALELTSLPTYIMVGAGRDNIEAQEAAVKYFFLGAMSAAIFLYGFALIYGATGYTDFAHIHAVAQEQLQATGSLSPLFVTGIVVAIVGLCFKIAAVPMHFYAGDVYEGAASPVTAFLAFVPKTAGFVAIILLLSMVGWPLDRTPNVIDSGDALVWILWGIAALTMTVGNVLALLQNNVKRVLAYSSIAHSGYILVGVLAGTGVATSVAMRAGPSSAPVAALNDGIGAVLFYLVIYGLATIAAFAVLSCVPAKSGDPDGAQTFDDISGLAKRHPVLAAIMAAAVLSLLGVPPFVGFLGKVYLFAPAISAGFIALVVIAVINSAISAAYYLHIASACYFGQPTELESGAATSVAVSDTSAIPHPTSHIHTTPWRPIGAGLAALAVLILFFAAGPLIDAARQAPHAATTHAPLLSESAHEAPRLVASPTPLLSGSEGAGFSSPALPFSCSPSPHPTPATSNSRSATSIPPK